MCVLYAWLCNSSWAQYHGIVSSKQEEAGSCHSTRTLWQQAETAALDYVIRVASPQQAQPATQQPQNRHA